MLLAVDFRRQARVCARLAEDCDDRCLAERLKAMASDLLAKADDFEELPGEPVSTNSKIGSRFRSAQTRHGLARASSYFRH